MLNVPQLDDMNYNAMFERARRMIPRLTPEWTDLNHHDPGITTIQMFYWLIDSLNYYLDATGEQHRLKYLKLLGIESQAAPATCHVAVTSGKVRLLKGTRLYAGDTVFETTAPFEGANNPAVGIYNEINGKKKDVTLFAGIDGSYAELFSTDTDDECYVYIGFKNKIKDTLSMYVEIEDIGRNFFDDNFRLSVCDFEYFDGEKFAPCSLESDGTNGFLRTGFIKLNLDGVTKKYSENDMQPLHYIRCRMTQNEYDVLPSLGRIFTACVGTVQTNTYASTHFAKYLVGDTLKLDFCVREDDNVKIAIKKDDRYSLWYDSQRIDDYNKCTLIDGELVYEKHIKFSNTMPQEGDEFVIFVCNSTIQDMTHLGRTDGCAGQRLHFDADPDSVCELKIAMTYEEGGEIFCELWDYSDDLSAEAYDSRSFGYDQDSGCIVLGDGLGGIQPTQGREVKVVTVKTSLFEKGNVLKGRIDTLELHEEKDVINLENSSGGARKQNSKKLESLIEEKLTAVTRAVTAQDYKTIVLNSPGLLIDGVNVIPIKDYCEAYNEPFFANTVVLAVKPKHGGRLPLLTESYRKNIAANLKKYRLLTTDIRVVSARYVGVSVYGRIALVENTRDARESLEKFLKSEVDSVGKALFGKTVDYGRLFSALELHPNVKQIGDFSLEYNGNGGYKNEQGDIVMHPDSISYLKEIGIEFV